MKDKLKQVYEAVLENHQWHKEYEDFDSYSSGSLLATANRKAITILRDLIDAPEPEPVAVVIMETNRGYGTTIKGTFPLPDLKTVILLKDVDVGTKLYAAPPQREPLSDDRILELLRNDPSYGYFLITNALSFARAIERELGVK